MPRDASPIDLVVPDAASRPAGALRAAYEELGETAETVAEDLGHALEESVGELLDAASRVWRSGPRAAPAVVARAVGNVVAGWMVADRHAATRVLVAGRRGADLLKVTASGCSP